MAKTIMILVVLFVMVSFAACTPVSPQEKAVDSSVQVCKDLVLYSTSVDKLLNQEYESRNALEAQFSVVRSNFSNLVQSIANLKTVKTENFQQAADDLISTYQNVPQDASITDTIAQLKEPIAQVKIAADQLSTDLKCAP
jgi:hypothetical protein